MNNNNMFTPDSGASVIFEPDKTAAGPKHTVIMGCESLGAAVSTALAERGHKIHIVDTRRESFDRLPVSVIQDGHIVPVLGNGTIAGDLVKASIQDADVFMALSDNDTINALAGQIAKHIHKVPRVICRIDDPSRQEMYNDLDMVAISSTNFVTQTIIDEAVS